jgi:hypothetical protein
MIDIKTIDRKTGMDTHDLIRDGRSIELDPVKVAAVLKALVDEVNRLTEEIKRVKRMVRKKVRVLKGGLTENEK